MNIFILDEDPRMAAQHHADIHLNKMILESAQMLSTTAAVLLNEGKQVEGLYKPTHINHPCTVWLRESPHNIAWVVDYAVFLEIERQARFGPKLPEHKSLAVVKKAANNIINNYFNRDFFTCTHPLHTAFAEVVPDHIKRLVCSTVAKYRMAYKLKQELGMNMVWSRVDTPYFME